MPASRSLRLAAALLAPLLAASITGCLHAPPEAAGSPRGAGASVPAPAPASAPAKRTIHAEVVALEQVVTYNRFGSHNPYAMIYALKRDIVATDGGDKRLPGAVRLRGDKRPRPLVLRGNVGDVLEIRFTNLLREEAPDLSSCEAGRCDPPFTNLGQAEAPEAIGGAEEEADEVPADSGALDDRIGRSNDWPSTRDASIVIPGLEAVEGNNPRCTGLQSIKPGVTVTCRWKLAREGAFQFFSHGAPAGGEGDGGSLNQGLFGVVTVEPAGSRWYRSQVDKDSFDAAWASREIPGEASFARPGTIDYGQLDMLEPAPRDGVWHLRHGDLNAVVHECARPGALAAGCKVEGDTPAFREFTVVFHDELKTFYADPFTELESERQFQGIGDGFAINYGASGMGSILLANRKGIGPAAGCVECVYEEFFLQSWANGDPALLEEFKDDPSNVHHSYLNDRVRFRNLHVGKETHVFHLHAHQWESTPGGGSYLDSQTIAPGQAFQYEIYRGGLRHQGSVPQWETNGSGNRNRTVGDSIFHCHLYPHFAQGMWALWRVHDVLEDGSRTLPDGQAAPGRTQARVADPAATVARPGTNLATGVGGAGTPIPALVPLPRYALPPLPTYGEAGMPGYPFYIAGQAGHRVPQPPLDFALDDSGKAQDGGLPRHRVTGGTRGMAHLSAASVAARFPNPAARGKQLIKRALALGDMSAELEAAHVELLPDAGTPLERRAMDFHAGKTPSVLRADGLRMPTGGAAGYPSLLARPRDEPGGPPPGPPADGRFFVNGAAPARGAPFADPCRIGTTAGADAWDPANPGGKLRRYDVSAVQFDLVTNKAGWHDPQARINVLSSQVAGYEGRTRGAEPFFFRAESGECIEFRHSNRTPKDLELDDFQVTTPTDVIGQHIHLVKFDVTSSDGSANGWNYEDGTFAPDAVHERLCAATSAGGSVRGGSGAPLSSPLACGDHERPFADYLRTHADGRSLVQTTVQRWFADPLLTGAKDAAGSFDRTLGTVFTHDHFGPSSIQQHGFYSALLIEPKGAEWTRPDGSPLGDGVGAVAVIKGADDADHHPDTREFALAVADFALLYEPPQGPSAADKGIDQLIATARRTPDVVFEDEDDLNRLEERRREIRRASGVPVDPPALPESISTDHHNPYLVNYRGEPIPLRIGERSRGAGGLRVAQHPGVDCDKLTAGTDIDLRVLPRGDISGQRLDRLGDMEWVFYSLSPFSPEQREWLQRRQRPVEHGDPCTPLLKAHQGERVSVRLVQGAQEVQHTLAFEGLGWKRQPQAAEPSAADADGKDNPLGLVGAQEVGISEHFELDVPALGASFAEVKDYLYHFGSQDALWNGAWGLLRAYGRGASGVPDPAVPQHLYGGVAGSVIAGELAGTGGSAATCPALGRFSPVVVTAVATQARRLGGAAANGLVYREGSGARPTRLRDPDALVLLPVAPADAASLGLAPTVAEVDDWIADQASAGAGAKLEPFVARVRAGDCVSLRIFNGLRSEAELASQTAYAAGAGLTQESRRKGLPDARGDAGLPGITSLAAEGDWRADASNLRPGAELSFTLPLVWQDGGNVTGRAIGGSRATGLQVDASKRTGSGGSRIAPVFQMSFFAGRAEIAVRRRADGRCEQDDQGRCIYDTRAVPYAFGPLPLKPLGDVIGQGAHGLFGAVIVEPAHSSFHHPQSGVAMRSDELGTEALICRQEVALGQHCPEGQHFREFVVVAQDGLNLHRDPPFATRPARSRVVDCLVCDDSYDRGDKGFNYRSEPFWARLRDGGQDVGPRANLNAAVFPPTFFMQERQPIATPGFEAYAGEELRFRVLHPSGRARQRSFLVGGHDYVDLLDGLGSPGAALLAPGKAFTARIGQAHAGCWLYRDGATTLFSGGSWGSLRVHPSKTEAVRCPVARDAAADRGARPASDAASDPASEPAPVPAQRQAAR